MESTPHSLNDWHWWLGTIGLMAAVFGFVRWSLRKSSFLTSLRRSRQESRTRCDPSSLIAKLSMNLLVIVLNLPPPL